MGRRLLGRMVGRRGDVTGWVAVVAARILMLCSGAIHIHLWDTAYRHVATPGPLFMVQAAAALVLAVVLVVTRVVAVALGCIALMLGTVAGFILADTVGIFGFTLPVVTNWPTRRSSPSCSAPPCWRSSSCERGVPRGKRTAVG